jgi:hypothetical protein
MIDKDLVTDTELIQPAGLDGTAAGLHIAVAPHIVPWTVLAQPGVDELEA